MRCGNQSKPCPLRVGAAARNSIGLVLVGGMTIGTIFTLFVVLTLYVLVAKKRRTHDVPADGLAAVLAGGHAAAMPR